MSSKPIPKFRKEKANVWSKDHLQLHLAGLYRSKDDTVHYSIYPELISEQANTILTQIDQVLRDLREKERKVSEVIFIMDNHNTQKNSYVFGHLEALAKTGYISKQGEYHAQKFSSHFVRSLPLRFWDSWPYT